MDMGRRAEKRQLYREGPRMHGTVKMNYHGSACLAQHGENKNKQEIREFFQSRCRNGLPRMVELVQKEQEDLIDPRRPRPLGSHVNHGYVEG